MTFIKLLTVYIALVLLLALTVGAAYLPFGHGLKPAFALLVAAAKTALIVLFFMELRWRNGIVRIFATAGVFWLLLLCTLTLADFWTRG